MWLMLLKYDVTLKYSFIIYNKYMEIKNKIYDVKFHLQLFSFFNVVQIAYFFYYKQIYYYLKFKYKTLNIIKIKKNSQLFI